MAGGIELGTAYVQIVPSLRGASKSIERQLSGIDSARMGERLGGGLGEGVSRGFGSTGVPEVERTLSGSLAKMGQAAQDLGGRLSDAGGALTAGFTLPLGAAAVGAGAFALKAATSAETVEMGFETMLGSAEAAQAMMADLADFARTTPFELSGLQEAAKRLMAYGFAAEDVIPMLENVGDATAALGTGQEGINQVTRALGQMQAKGKVSAEEMLQLTEAGIPAWEFLAESIGTDTAGAMDAVTRGAVDATTGIKALTDGMGREFGGLMEEQAKTIPGIMSNIADSIQQPLMALKDSSAYDALADALSEVADAAGPFVKSLMPHMESGLRAVAKVVDLAAGALERFTSMSYKDQQSLIKLAGAAAAAGPALKVLGGSLKLAGGAAKGAAKLLDVGGVAASKMGAAAKGAVSKLKGLASGAEGAGAMAKVAAGGMKLLKASLPIAALGLAVTAIGRVVGKLKEQREHAELVSAATESMASMNERAKGSVDAMGAALSGMATDGEGALRSLADLNAEYVDTMSEMGVQSAELDRHVAVIQELAGQSNLTASEQQKLKQAVEGYNSITGESVEVTDAARGALSQTTDEIAKNADAWKENARAQAMQELAAKYLKENIENTMQLDSATAELKRRQDELNSAQADGKGFFEIEKCRRAVEEQQQEVKDLGEAVRESGSKYEELSGMAVAATADVDRALRGALDDLPPAMQAKGADIALKLSEGIKGGKVPASDAASFMSDGVMAVVEGMPGQMQAKGLEAAYALAGAVSSGSITAQQAASVLRAAVSGEVSNLPPELQPYGEQAAAALGNGMSLQQQLAASGGTALKDAAKAGASPITADMEAMGTGAQQSLAAALKGGAGNVGGAAASLDQSARGGVSGLKSAMQGAGSGSAQGMAGGMRSGEGGVRASAQTLSDAASAMGNGDAWSWGNEMGNNFASGISGAFQTVSNAAASIAGAVADFLHFTEPDKGPLVGINDSGYEMAQNYAHAMMRGRGLVARASESLAGAARFDVEPAPAGARGRATGPEGASGRAGGTGYGDVREILLDILHAMPEPMTPREFRRAVASCG